MSDEGGLFDAVLESPEDGQLRLICADWFEEHGDADRAEFVRLQCSLAGVLNDLPLYAEGFDPWQREARLPLWRRFLETAASGVPRAPELVRESGLLQSNRRRWNGALHRRLAKTPLAGWVGSRRCGIRGWAYRRGFVEAVACTPEAWHDHGHLLRRALGPIRYLRLHVYDARITASWWDLDLGGLEVVAVEGEVLAGIALRSLLTAENARELPVLDLRHSQVVYDREVDSWLSHRPSYQRPRVLYHLPNPLPPLHYPPPFLPTMPQAPWLIAWLSGG